MARQATDTFTIPIDGAPIGVTAGEIFPEGHLVLRRMDEIAPDSHLFRPVIEEPEPKAKQSRGRAPGKAAD